MAYVELEVLSLDGAPLARPLAQRFDAGFLDNITTGEKGTNDLTTRGAMGKGFDAEIKGVAGDGPRRGRGMKDRSPGTEPG